MAGRMTVIHGKRASCAARGESSRRDRAPRARSVVETGDEVPSGPWCRGGWGPGCRSVGSGYGMARTGRSNDQARQGRAGGGEVVCGKVSSPVAFHCAGVCWRLALGPIVPPVVLVTSRGPASSERGSARLPQSHSFARTGDGRRGSTWPRRSGGGEWEAGRARQRPSRRSLV